MAIVKVARRQAALTRCVLGAGERAGPYESWRYGNGRAIQVTPDAAALFCGVRPEKMGGPDYVDGSRVVLFDDLDRIADSESVPLASNEFFGDPKSGKARMAMKHGVWPWFVPAGARLADGAPHPWPGTGFGLQSVLEVPVDENLRWGKGALYKDAEKRTAVYQFRCGARGFEVVGVQEHKPEDMPVVPTHPITAQMEAVAVGDRERFRWRLADKGLGPGLPDGADMLMPAMAARVAPEGDAPGRPAAGVMRWRCDDGEWKPVHFTPIAVSVDGVEQYWHEPSLVRARDGALLFSARPRFGPYEHTVRLWRSEDGMAWQVVFDRLQARAESPVTINSAADGTPYFALNPWFSEYEGMPYTHGRRRMDIRPMRPDLSDWGEGLLVRRTETGRAERSRWLLDHPLSATIRLKDGVWRHVLAYRSLFSGAFDEMDEGSLSYGLYLDAIESDGPAIAPWRFD